MCSQVQHPEVLVVVELFPIWRGKLSPKDPELTPTLGNHHCLRDGWRENRDTEEGKIGVRKI